MAITRSMWQVTISHCDYRRGYATLTSFLGDIPQAHRVNGWLRVPGSGNRPRPFNDALAKAELLVRRP